MIPSATNPKWTKLVKGEIKAEYKFLALKIALTRHQQKVKQNSSELNSSINELVEFFKKNEALMADDIKTIFG